MVTASKRKSPAIEPAKVTAAMRRSHPWLEVLFEDAKAAAVKRRRKDGRTKGSMLSPEKLTALSDELEELQRQINPLDLRRKAIVEELVAHWAHTGVEEIESSLGKTLVSLSFELGIDPRKLKKIVGSSMWERFLEPVLQPAKIITLHRRSGIRRIIEQAAVVRRLKVSVTPPSSRRPKSGASEDEDESGET